MHPSGKSIRPPKVREGQSRPRVPCHNWISLLPPTRTVALFYRAGRRPLFPVLCRSVGVLRGGYDSIQQFPEGSSIQEVGGTSFAQVLSTIWEAKLF